MKIETVIPCVHYDDFLALTLPHNLPLLDSVTVLTSPRDRATIQLAQALGAKVFATESWHFGGPLNKGRALNQWLAYAAKMWPDRWVMVLDADVRLSAEPLPNPDSLDPRGLYSVRRRMCEDLDGFEDFLEGRKAAQEFPLETVPTSNGRLWGKLHTANAAALFGYLQLWCPVKAAGMPRFPETGTAEGCDLLFGLSFPQHARTFLEPLEVLHLGPSRVNWRGRRSPQWPRRGKAWQQSRSVDTAFLTSRRSSPTVFATSSDVTGRCLS